MESRVDKYSNNVMSRTEKNHHLYEDISETEINSFDVNSNATVLGNNSDVIDVNKLRDMLDKKYREEPKKNKLSKFDDTSTDIDVKLEETAEYDINAIMDKAKENKEEDYEVERLKKLRNTQFDILNELNLPKLNSEVEEPKVASKDESEKLMELINTINVTEAINKRKNLNDNNENNKSDDMDPLDLFSDLKGHDDTRIFGAQELQEINSKSQELIDLPLLSDNKTEKVTDEEYIGEEPKNEDNDIDKSFYTTSTNLSKTDFDDFNDLQEEVASTKIIIRILIIIVVLAFIFGLFFILNKTLNWGII